MKEKQFDRISVLFVSFICLVIIITMFSHCNPSDKKIYVNDTTIAIIPSDTFVKPNSCITDE